MKRPLLPQPLLVAAFAALSSLSSRAAVVTGDLRAIDHPQYAGIASQFSIENARADGTQIYDGEIFIFCADLAARSLDEDLSNYPHSLTTGNSNLSIGTLEEFDVWDRYSTQQDESLAIAQIHWLVDNFYESHFTSPTPGSENLSQYALQNVIWEIFGDGGTPEGLSFDDGNIDRSRFQSSSPALWSEMNFLLDAVANSGVTGSYVSTYTILGVLDDRDGYQDYLALAATPELMAVPEPGVTLLGASAALLLLRRRGR